MQPRSGVRQSKSGILCSRFAFEQRFHRASCSSQPRQRCSSLEPGKEVYRDHGNPTHLSFCRVVTSHHGRHGASNSYMSYTSDPNGNWSAPVKIFEEYLGGDTNFAPLILRNGSIVAMWRHWGGVSLFLFLAIFVRVRAQARFLLLISVVFIFFVSN